MTHLFEMFASYISGGNRHKKWLQFLDLMKPKKSDLILDVGVNAIEYSEYDNYLERHYAWPENITAISLENGLDDFRKRYPKVTTLTGDGTQLKQASNSFDIVYSNAVIEHVGGKEQQIVFLRELYRVGKKAYITTPNRFFPIEVHTRIPLLHILLSKERFDQVCRWLGKEWATGNYMHLLSQNDLREILKQAGISNFQIIPQRFLGFTMTFTLIWKK